MKAIPWDGKQITKPGLYSKIPLAKYHSANICDGPSISSSGLRRIDPDNDGSPAHFYAEWPGNPAFKGEESSAQHLVIGRAVHHLILGEKGFSNLFVIRPEEYPDRRLTKTSNPELIRRWMASQKKLGEPDFGMRKWNSLRIECLEWIAEQKKLGKTILTGDDAENIKGMAKGLARLPLVGSGILTGQIERSLFWKDKATGIWLKARPDVIPTGSGDFADLKTTTSVQWNDLMRTITEYKYHQQAALMRTGAQEVLKLHKDAFTFTLIFIEKKNPWCGRTVQLKPGDLDMGERQNRKALDLFASCLKNDSWPGPGENDDAPYIDLQDYYRNRITERLG